MGDLMQTDGPTKMKIWSCKIGEVPNKLLPQGADSPMRRAVERAYYEMTGVEPKFLFSGWGAELDQGERDVVNDTQRRLPSFYVRLLTESKELEERKEKLAGFITASPDFLKLDKDQRDLLTRQFDAMQEYAAVLGQRILTINPAERDAAEASSEHGEVQIRNGDKSETPVPFDG